MQHYILQQNELLLVDYLPGSSGQLFMRLWIELDSRHDYNSEHIMDPDPINSHLASREIDYPIEVPKRIINWFIDKNQPKTIDDYAAFLEFLSMFITAQLEKKSHLDLRPRHKGFKFYRTADFDINDYHIIYGFHAWRHVIPTVQLRELGYNVKTLGIVPKTEHGLNYQRSRLIACYPRLDTDTTTRGIEEFNNKQHDITFDLCTLLVENNTTAIIDFYRQELGHHLLEHKINKAIHILNVYHETVVKCL